MSVIRPAARIATAWIFIHSGSDVLRHPEGRVKASAEVLQALRRLVPLPGDDDAALVRANAAVQLGAGLLLVSGRFQRLASAALAMTLIPVTLAGHQFWTIKDPAHRSQQRIHFNKNLSMFGGLVLVATAPHARTQRTEEESTR
jgi:putative oxidoreductase